MTRRRQPSIAVQEIAHHRNGIGGEPFHVVAFRDREEGNMIATVFAGAGRVAVLQVDKVSRGVIAFTENSWRGDLYEPALRAAIAAEPHAFARDARHRDADACSVCGMPQSSQEHAAVAS